MKLIDGDRQQLERQLATALFKGDEKTFQRLNQRLSARAMLASGDKIPRLGEKTGVIKTTSMPANR